MTLLFMLFMACGSWAVSGNDAAEKETVWRYNLVPFYWGPDVDVNLQLADQAQHVQQDFMEDSGVFKPHTFGLGLGALRNDWGWFSLVESFDAEMDFDLPDGSSGKIDFEHQRLDLGVVYQWQASPYKGSKVYVTPWLGLRYRHAGLRLTDVSSPDEESGDDPILQSEDSHWVDTLAGFRVQWVVVPKWSLSIKGDMDGLFQDHVSWSGASWVKYHWRKEFSLGVGYRYDQFEFQHGSGDALWAAEGTSAGWIFGLELDFFAFPSSAPGSWDHLPSLADPEERRADEAIPAGMKEADLPGLVGPPKEEGRLGQALDLGHDFVNEKLDFGVEAIDTWMLDDQASRLPRKKSQFFLALDTRFTEQADGGTSMELRPSVDAKVELPNLENTIKLAISTSSVDEKPGTDTFDREEGIRVGMEKTGLFWKKTKFKAGIRSSLDLYTSFSWVPEWRRGDWRVSPEARAYYRTDKGAGLVGSLGFKYHIKNRYRAGWLSSVEAGKETDWDTTWLNNLSFAYLFEGSEEDHHRAIFMNLSIKGLWEAFEPQSYRWTPLRYRAPLYKNWLYWEVGPEITWRRQDQWEPEPAMRFAFSSLFWGTKER